MNHWYTIFNQQSFKNERVVYCPEEDIHHQLKENEFWIAGCYPDNEYYWNNGIQAIPPAPGDNHVFNHITETWEPVLATFNELSATKRQLLQECDWTQLPDVSLSPEKKEAWRIYRQAVRDAKTLDDLPLIPS